MNMRTAICYEKSKPLHIDEVESVSIGAAAGLQGSMNIPGRNLKGVYTASTFLARIDQMKVNNPDNEVAIRRGKKVVVIGGGNSAIKAARCARRLGADVTIVSRRAEAAEDEQAQCGEVRYAREDGIDTMSLTGLVRISGNERGWVSDIICQDMMQIKDLDQTGRRKVIPIYETEFAMEADCVILADDSGK